MSRKHYEAIARAISDGQFVNCATQAELAMNANTRSKIAHDIADVLRANSASFNRDRFLAACGVRA
jgi:hypothetical protein